MQTQSEASIIEHKLERVGTVLRWAGWASFGAQLTFAATAGLMLVFAISGRNFNEAAAPTPPVSGARVIDTNTGTPGLGIGVFWAVCGVVALLVGIYFAFRQTRFAKRLRHSNATTHPKKAEILQLLRWGVIVGLIGLLLNILGGGATLGVLLAKSIVQPQGVAIYDPSRIIRSLDIFVAMANMNGIAAHFIGATSSLALLNWTQRQ
jgi:hypothetical protein